MLYRREKGERERPRPIELERGICRTPRGEVRGHCLILIKRARLIVSGNPVCHGRYARASLWHRLTYGLACCLPIQGPSTCSPQLDKFPEPCLPKEWGLLLLFSRLPSPPTCFLLILQSAGAIERSCIIQGGLARERERRGLVRRERGRWMAEPDSPQRQEWETLTDGGVGWGQRNIITKNNSRVLQAEPFRADYSCSPNLNLSPNYTLPLL